ncbi:DUF4179 domain-containing protein [Paenibacillus oralis]|uniref:DUF4179 domain-containing protein n=1 Tax=Paenibacillus oralis TaxID=2490856 RepID=A0A3P3TYH0_9BACL|nr:DUF4179 domain-containing protein [Paenibacillus oralis]RRJ63145.1 DUF4179 domain-containing protein [Paenibacillus oralis]
MVETRENQLVRYFDGARQAEQQISEGALASAIGAGLARGKNARRKRAVQRGAVAAGLLACCLLIAAVWPVWTMPGTSTVMSSPPGIPGYVLSQMTTPMEQAADQGLYQPINKSAEVEGYKVTVDGVLADNETMIVFYTLENLSGSDQSKDMYIDFFDTDGNLLIVPDIWNESNSSVNNTERIKHGFIRLTFSDTTPGHIIFAAGTEFIYKDESSVKIPIELDTRRYAGLERTIPVNQSAKIGGRHITIGDVILRPLSTTIRFDPKVTVSIYEPANMQAKLYLGEKREKQFRYYIKSRTAIYSEGQNEADTLLSAIVFDSLYYEDWNEVTLQVDGWGTSDNQPQEFKIKLK